MTRTSEQLDDDRNELSLLANGALGLGVSRIVASAGRGDLEAQRHIFRARYEAMDVAEASSLPAFIAAVETVVLGRMVASHGHISDLRALAAALINASTVYGATEQHELCAASIAESVSILEQLAERGDDLAASSSEALIKQRPAEFIDLVRWMRGRGEESEA